MSRGANTFVGVNWGSTNFRAYLIGADGSAVDEYSAPAGVVNLDRTGMAATMDALAARWPNSGPVYASGMIGSNVGWKEVPYAEAPAGCADLAAAAVATEIGSVPVHIVPGITCRRSFDGEPDILRGEEVEMMGLASLGTVDGWVALPGTHTKWARLERGRVVEFFTSMSGEIFDRLTAKGLLASIVEGEAQDGPVFLNGVAAGRARKLSLGTLLFGARAKVVRGFLSKPDAASYIRGMLIGSEIADAMAVYPTAGDAVVPLVGSRVVCALYASALSAAGISSAIVDSRIACLRGFKAVHELRHG
ncbi:2-dehydro-3-deoxygalactonokinase [Peristeroidobacter agariperforans]|uniref:2-dehydro-3-deoxygalactonokinase n=1 Tax=Peristeroidobacter agariperforans TaxID=268404 RepID=UPI0013006CA4|nr:2-dehydro-3-deoxygalactonokinase [Peristeroidobacter agariperforans]